MALANKRLWQIIGLDNKQVLQKQQLYRNLSECSTIKRSEKQKCPIDASREQYGILYNIDSHDKRPKVEDQNRIKTQPFDVKDADFCIEMESCESKVIKSQNSSLVDIEFEEAQSKEINIRSSVKSLALSVGQLRKQNQSLNKTIKHKNQQIRNALLHTQAEIIERIQNTVNNRQLHACLKCEVGKKTIDRLTKQYWEMEILYNEKIRENKEMSVEMGKYAIKQDNFIKNMETKLLQQRGQVVQNLKQQVIYLKDQLQKYKTKLDRKQLNQTNYRNYLTQMQNEVDNISYDFTVQLGKIKQEKDIIQSQYTSLQKLYDQLDKRFEKFQLEYNHKKVSEQRVLNRGIDSQTSLRNFLQSNHAGSEMQTTKQCYNFQFSKIPNSSMRQLHSGQLSRLSSEANLSRQRQQPNYHNNCSIIYNSKPPIKDKWINLSARSNNSSKRSENIARYLDPRPTNFQVAFANLSEIQRDVRKQINRSKFARK